MDVDDVAQEIFDKLDDRGCFNGIDRDIRREILKEIGDIIEKTVTHWTIVERDPTRWD